MTISVLIPVKNGAKYLGECLDSILVQTFKDFEVIIVNDFSTDNTVEILNSYKQRDLRIKWFQNHESGIIGALRLALSKSSGNFITRMDADDIMSKDKLATMYHQLNEKGRRHVAVGLVKYFSDKALGEGYKNYESWLNRLSQTASNFDGMYKECAIPSPCWMLHREDLLEIGAFNSDRYPEDYDLAFRMKKANFQVIPAHKIVHYWRDYSQRTSRTDPRYEDNRFLDLKLDYFLDIDYNPNQILIIWGAGKKGKYIAKCLTEKQVPFQWVTNNPKKIGKSIYGVVIEEDIIISKLSNAQIIKAIAVKTKSFSSTRVETHTFFHFS